MRGPFLISVVIVAALGGTAQAGNGGFVPPLRIDTGPAVSALETEVGVQSVIGIHWASLYPKGTASFDVGIGLITSFVPTDDAEPQPYAARELSSTHRDEPLSLIGGYVEVAKRTAGNSWWRTWVGLRVESGQADKDGRSKPYVGVAARYSTEAYLPAAESGSGGGVLGVLAIGLYAELAGRRIDVIGDDVTASIGLSFRVPLIAAH
jgi:hypothetical protein